MQLLSDWESCRCSVLSAVRAPTAVWIAVTTLFDNVRRELGDESSRAELVVGLACAGAGRDRVACAHLQTAFETAPSGVQRLGWISMIRADAEYRAARSLPGVSVLLDRFGEEE